MYYDEEILEAIASSIVTLVKVHINTRMATRARFVRVYVEIDLTKPLVGNFWLGGRWHKVEYEGLHVVCFQCGRYGH